MFLFEVNVLYRVLSFFGVDVGICVKGGLILRGLMIVLVFCELFFFDLGFGFVNVRVKKYKLLF